MSSPNAAGCIALIVSALKQGGHDALATTQRIRRAVEATALAVDGIEPWALGRGLIQVEAAHAYLVSHGGDAYHDVDFQVCL
jgi:tripeptidyl-peptidase-2